MISSRLLRHPTSSSGVLAEALEVGMVGTNTGILSQAVIPFGGIKESGVRGGARGLV
jgi:acyl-CoA reductase-like NAD-dependent aldehyde dehydrogenase